MSNLHERRSLRREESIERRLGLMLNLSNCCLAMIGKLAEDSMTRANLVEDMRMVGQLLQAEGEAIEAERKAERGAS